MLAMSFKISIHIFLPIFIGGFLYVGYRSTSLLMFNWADNLGLYGLITDFRNVCKSYQFVLPNWVKYSLPDLLWTYAFTSSFCLFWRGRNKFYWCILPFVFSVGFEVLQFYKIVGGTFDLVDLFFCLTAYLISILIIKPYKNEKISY
jgi:hypothetical protein